MAAIFFASLTSGSLLTVALADARSSRQFLRLATLISLGIGIVASFLAWREMKAPLVIGVSLAGLVIIATHLRHLGVMRLLAVCAWAAFVYMAMFPVVAEKELSAWQWVLMGGTQVVSGLVMGTALMAMMLGHSYLTQRGMGIGPLKRLTYLFAIVFSIRVILSIVGAIIALSLLGDSDFKFELYRHVFMVFVRCFAGLVLPAVLGYMVVQAVQMRSTQSATGILYIVTVLVLIGELVGQYLLMNMGLTI